MSVEGIHIESTLTTGTYSIDDFNGKVKAPVIQQRQDWEAPQTKKSKNYIFMVSNRFFIALDILINYLQRTTRNKSTLPISSYKISIDTSSFTISISLHCKQINRVKNEVDG